MNWMGLLAASTLLIGCGGEPFSAAVQAASDAGVEASTDARGDGFDGGLDGEAPDVADAGEDAPLPVFVLCAVVPTSEAGAPDGGAPIPFGCGDGWEVYRATLPAPTQASIAAAGPYNVVLHPAGGPATFCRSAAAPTSWAGFCPTSSGSDHPVPCDVDTSNEGFFGSAASCVSMTP